MRVFPFQYLGDLRGADLGVLVLVPALVQQRNLVLEIVDVRCTKRFAPWWFSCPSVRQWRANKLGSFLVLLKFRSLVSDQLLCNNNSCGQPHSNGGSIFPWDVFSTTVSARRPRIFVTGDQTVDSDILAPQYLGLAQGKQRPGTRRVTIVIVIVAVAVVVSVVVVVGGIVVIVIIFTTDTQTLSTDTIANRQTPRHRR